MMISSAPSSLHAFAAQIVAAQGVNLVSARADLLLRCSADADRRARGGEEDLVRGVIGLPEQRHQPLEDEHRGGKRRAVVGVDELPGCPGLAIPGRAIPNAW